MNMFVQVHETCLLDFLRYFHKDKLGCGLKIVFKEKDLYTLEIFISSKTENLVDDYKYMLSVEENQIGSEGE